MDNKRRSILKAGIGLTGAGVFAVGYKDKAESMVRGMITGTSGKETANKITGNALEPEYRVNGDKLELNPNQCVSYTQCFGCWTLCGIRARVDKVNNEVIRIAGNPYHPLSADKYVDYETSVEQAMLSTSGEHGLDGRSTACARGAALLEGINSPHRVTKILKRVGKRGEGKWKTISYKQLIDEISDGGDLFGEGHVDGLRTIRNTKELIDPNNPEFGVKSNQLLFTHAGRDGRESLMDRFAKFAYGTANVALHGAYCTLSYRSGSGALMNDLKTNAHAKPDYDNCKFILFMGTSPAQSGNPFKRQARLLAQNRTRDDFSYVVVAPNLQMASTIATKDNVWVPIKPNRDLSLAFAMMQWIFENNTYNADYLANPSLSTMKKNGFHSYSNASHLVICDKNHAKFNSMLRASDLSQFDEKSVAAKDDKVQENYFVVQEKTGELVLAKDCNSAEIFVDREVTLKDGSMVRVKSSLQILKDNIYKNSFDFYAKDCGIDGNIIKSLAKEFTSHGTKAAVITQGGSMHSNGFYTTWAILLLNVLIGNMNLKGGMSVAGGKVKPFAGPRYDLANFPNKFKQKVTNMARSKKPYEKSSEYKNHVKNGENPYPSKATWYPFTGGQVQEMLSSVVTGYPFRPKAWISVMSNPIYGVPGLKQYAEESLKDPKKLPLIIAVDTFMNETTALADYIVPDTNNFESYGFTGPWAAVMTKATTARWPVIDSPNPKTEDGRVIGLDNFLIDLAKNLKLPGFGKNAISDHLGNKYNLDNAEDYYIKAAANLAYDKSAIAPTDNAIDYELTGVSKLLPKLKQALKPEEVLLAASVFAKGGRFENFDHAYKGELINKQWTKCLQFFNEQVGKNRNSITGNFYNGSPEHHNSCFADGTSVESHYSNKEWPFLMVSYKSNLMSSITAPITRLYAVKSHGFVTMHIEDAKKLDIKHGDLIEIQTPQGAKERTRIMVGEGVKQGVIAIEHGWGHSEHGARDYTIDDEVVPASHVIGKGININNLSLVDYTRKAPVTWVDWMSGNAVRQGLPAKVVKVSS